MKISEPIFIEKVKRLGYMATGKLEGYGRIKEYGFSEEEAKERFFEACERQGERAACGGDTCATVSSTLKGRDRPRAFISAPLKGACGLCTYLGALPCNDDETEKQKR